MPDSDYLNSEKGSSSFSGAVLVEDWEGRLIKGFEISKGKIRSLVSIADSIKPEKREEITPGELGATITSLSVYCQTTTWRSCAYMDGEYKYCQVMYSETSCWGSWGGGSYTDDSHYWDEDGGGSADNYLPPAAPVFEVIPDRSIIENPITDCIYSKISPNNHGYDKFLLEFQKSTKYNVTFKLAPNLAVGGAAVNGYTNYQIGSSNVTIFINSSTLNRPSWEIAGTFIHEMAHAYLAQKLISIGGPGNLKQYATDTEFKDLFDYYAKYVNPETGQYAPTQNSAAHHNLMADLLITDIAEGIRDYVEANTPDIKNYSDITLEHYKAVA